MWNLLQTLWGPRYVRDGVTAPAAPADMAALVKQYKTGQVTATAVSTYFDKQGATGGPAAPVKAEATKDLERLRDSLSIKGAKDQPPEVATVKAILEKVKNGEALKPEDMQALKDVVKSLGTKLVATSPDTTGMPEDLKKMVAASPNADRAIATYKELKALQAKDTHTPKRLTDDMIRMMTEAVAKPRTDDVRGQAGVMGKESALRAATALVAMSDEDYKKTTDLLKATDTRSDLDIINPWADAQLEKTLILKAVGAGYKPVAPKSPTAATDGERNNQFFGQLGNFAKAIHEQSRDDLIRKTTLTGVEAGGMSLQQRYENSCGPTTTQMLKGGDDPMYAWEMHKDGAIHSLASGGKTAADQRALLETEGGGGAVAREAMETYGHFGTVTGNIIAAVPNGQSLDAAVNKRFGELFDATPTDEKKLEANSALSKYLNNPSSTPSEAEMKKIEEAIADLKAKGVDIDLAKVDKVRSDQKDMKTALETLRKYMEDPTFTPNDAEKAQIQTALQGAKTAGENIDQAKVDLVRSQVKEKGLATFQGGGTGMVLTDCLKAKVVGRNYSDPNVQDASGNVRGNYLDKAATSLENGQAVPLRIGYIPKGGHFMLMSDVRGASPDRQYLVSDPYSGTTQWVKEADLKDGSFAKKGEYGFGLGNAKLTHMYFPK